MTRPHLLSSSLLLALVLVAPARAQPSPYAVEAAPPAGFDRAAVQAETRALLEALIRTDTRNPPGNELAAARVIASALEGVPGVTVHVLEVPGHPGRANLVARLAATRATARPVIVMGHMDVVGAQEDRWTTPPLVPTEKDGYLYGRGTIDDKGMLAATVVSLRRLAARRDALTRDVILLATAGEEGGPAVGVDHVLEHHRALLGDAELALNEGGRVRIRDGRIETVNIQTTEKVPFNVKLRATGPSGHGSVPLRDNALAALARACARLHDWRAPVRLLETTRLFFRGLSSTEEDPALRQAMLDVCGDDAPKVEAAAEALSRDPLYAAVLRSAASLTLLQGGIRSNVIPSEGTAVLNLRVLPGDDPQALVESMRLAAAEPQVTLELDREPAPIPPPSPVSTPMFQALERAAKALAPGVVVVPYLSTGATDGAALRALGIPTYGILPFPLAAEDELRMHGDDERVPVEALGWGTELIYRTLADVAGN